MAFKVGDRVFWVSQAAGISRRKEGEVIEVVVARKKPVAKVIGEIGSSRDHESYVVKAQAIGTITKRIRNYWPIVSHLQKMPTQEKSFEEAFTEAGAKSIAEAEDKSFLDRLNDPDKVKELVKVGREFVQEQLNDHNPLRLGALLQGLAGAIKKADDSLPSDREQAEALATNAAIVEKLEASGPPAEASGAKFIIGVDMAKDNAEETAVVYHVTDKTTGLLRVCSKEEYDVAMGEKMFRPASLEESRAIAEAHDTITSIVEEPGPVPVVTASVQPGGFRATATFPETAPPMTEEEIERVAEKQRLYDAQDPTAGMEEPKE